MPIKQKAGGKGVATVIKPAQGPLSQQGDMHHLLLPKKGTCGPGMSFVPTRFAKV